jgi:hypothetical protein
MPYHPKTIKHTSFKGLNNTASPENTSVDYLKKVINIDIDKTGNLTKRKGYRKVDTANYSHIWASPTNLGCYGIRNGDLVRIYPDYSHKTLVSALGPIIPSFEEINGDVYLLSTSFNCILRGDEVVDWGIHKNTLSPTLSLSTGILSAGTYQVSFTYVNSKGFESGTTTASVITVPNGSGISVYIPTPLYLNDLKYARVYCSTTDGMELYYSDIASFNTTIIIGSTDHLVSPLRTFNLDAPPHGSHVTYYLGHMYIADESVLWYSEPFQYSYYKLSSNYIEFTGTILEVMAVDNGIWVGTTAGLYYLSGLEPSKFQMDIKETLTVISGTATQLSGSYEQQSGLPPGFKWLISTDLGIFLLANEGMLLNVSTPNVELEAADSGASLFLQTNGMNQYLSILKTNQNPNNAVATDIVTSTIVRNGVIIP